MAEFAKYIEQVKHGNADDSLTLLDCCREFVKNLERKQSEIIVLDSILPCWDWLLTAKCHPDIVAHFSQKLCALMQNLNPVLIYVEGSSEIALSRAIADRGEAWALNLAKARTGQHHIGSLLEYFTSLRADANRMVELWGHDIVYVNTTEYSVHVASKMVLDKMRLID